MIEKIGAGSRYALAAALKRGIAPVQSSEAAEPAVKSGEGTLLPEPGSDSSVLLGHLQNVLRGKAAPTAAATRTSVPFTYIDLGEKPPQAQDGAVGHWTALKLIFGEGEHESQVLLHINTGARKGQFAMKDPAYGDLATAELAKVL